MKKILLTVAIMATFSSVAMAQDFEQYVSGKGVWSRATNKFGADYDFKETKSIGGIRLAYGVIFPMGNNSVRTELEYGYNGKVKVTDEDYKSEVKSQSLMVNAYFDLNTGTNWTPYVGAGIGYSRLKNSLHFPGDESNPRYFGSKSKGNFGWNASVGTTYAFNKNVALDVSYRFTDYGKVEQDVSSEERLKVKQRANEFNLGVRYSF